MFDILNAETFQRPFDVYNCILRSDIPIKCLILLTENAFLSQQSNKPSLNLKIWFVEPILTLLYNSALEFKFCMGYIAFRQVICSDEDFLH